jgi:hypothetical protein
MSFRNERKASFVVRVVVAWSAKMVREDWSEWAVIQLQECIIKGIGPEETAGLLGRTKEDVYAKARELGLLLQDSPPTAPKDDEIFPRHIAVS